MTKPIATPTGLYKAGDSGATTPAGGDRLIPNSAAARGSAGS